MAGGANKKSEVIAEVKELIAKGIGEETAIVSVAHRRGIARTSVMSYISEARKLAKVGNSKIDLPEKKSAEIPDEEIHERLDRSLDLKRVQQERDHWRKQAERYRDQYRQQDEFLESLSSMVPKLPAVTPPKLSKQAKYGEALPMADWSDWHVFRTVSLAETEGMFEYNFDIFCGLYWDLLQKTVEIAEIQRSAHSIPKLWIVMGGDMMNDEHRPENMHNNEVLNALGLWKLLSVTVQGLRWLLKHFDSIDIDCVVGNEPRMDEKKRAKNQWRNWDWMLYHAIRIAMSNDVLSGRLRMFVPMSPDVVVEQMGFSWLITHGDKAKSWNGIPYYGINRYVMKQHDLRRQHRLFNPNGKDFHYTIMHDKHTMSDLNHHTTFVNGALCGTDEYAKNVLSVGGPRMQRLMFINDKYGPFCQYPLIPFADGGHPFALDDGHDFVSPMQHKID